jgi:hypothetical protein
MPRKSKVRKQYDTMLVLSAACAAQRVNGSYIKFATVEVPSINGTVNVHKRTNRELTVEYLELQENITDADRNMAEEMRRYWNGKMFKVLSGEYMSNFDRGILELMQKETVTEGYDIAVIASMPGSYISSVKRDERDRRVKFSQGGYIGTVGERIKTQVEVLKCVYSQKWFTYFITGITSSDQAVFFSYKEEVSVGNVLNIVGTVKRQDNNQTQLNRVKVL